VVLPGLIFPPAGLRDLMLIKQLSDLFAWSKSVAKIVTGGEGILTDTFTAMGELLSGTGTGGVQADVGARLRLPVTLGSPDMQRWDTGGQTNPAQPPHLR
jgi:hypothetical protein